MSRYLDKEGIRFRIGSLIYTNETAISNMGSATDCKSALNGLCDHPEICYGLKSERLYPNALPARRRQEIVWKTTPASSFIKALREMWDRNNVKRWRVNEVNDFSNQEDVDKLNEIANNIPQTVFTYTSNWKLNLTNLAFKVRLSHDFDVPGISGRAIVIPKGTPAPRGYVLCAKTSKTEVKRCDDGKCGICYSSSKASIAFWKH